MGLEGVLDVPFDSGEESDVDIPVATKEIRTQVDMIIRMNSQIRCNVFGEKVHISFERDPQGRYVFFVYFPDGNKKNICLHMRVGMKDIPSAERSPEWRKVFGSSAVKFITPGFPPGEHTITFYATKGDSEEEIHRVELSVTEKLPHTEKQIDKRPTPCTFTKKEMAQFKKKIEDEEKRRNKEKQEAEEKRNQERAERREKSIWNRLKKWWKSS